MNESHHFPLVLFPSVYFDSSYYSSLCIVSSSPFPRYDEFFQVFASFLSDVAASEGRLSAQEFSQPDHPTISDWLNEGENSQNQIEFEAESEEELELEDSKEGEGLVATVDEEEQENQ